MAASWVVVAVAAVVSAFRYLGRALFSGKIVAPKQYRATYQ